MAKKINIMKERREEGGMLMPLLKKDHYTIKDIEELPEGERAELIDGQIYMLATPSTRHQRLSRFLFRKIDSYIESKKGKCEVFYAPFGVFLKNEKWGEDFVEPDLMVICDPNKVDEKGCHGAPDWVIEIVSPSSKMRDYLQKANLYMNNGVREYWVVDPIRETTVVYKHEEEGVQIIHKFGEPIKVGIYEDLEITIE